MGAFKEFGCPIGLKKVCIFIPPGLKPKPQTLICADIDNGQECDFRSEFL